MNVILILLDSLNKNYLSCYGNEWIKTPNIKRLADASLVFNNHYIGSAPCMPARREIFTGRKEFMWRGWGQAEPFDDLLPEVASKAGAFTAMITDHYHYWDNSYGYGYIQGFDHVNMIRGAEADSWGIEPIDADNLPDWARSIEKYRHKELVDKYYRNVKNFKSEEDFQSPRVMTAAAEWLDKNSDNEKFLLMIESFDPHEPWYIPEPYRSMYGVYSDKFTCWPPYQRKTEVEKFRANTSDKEIEFIRSQYAGKVTMVDAHLKKVFDVMDQKGLWDNTAVILTTDHGHELFEKGKYGKGFPNWNTSANIPLIIWHPDLKEKGNKTEAFSSTVDINATVLDILQTGNIPAPDGRSQMPVIKGEIKSVRNAVLYGSFGTGACMYDGEYTCFCGYDNSNPLYWYSTHMRKAANARLTEAIAGKFIPGVEIPVWRYPVSRGFAFDEFRHPDLLYKNDIKQENNISKSDTSGLEACKKKLISLMEEEKVPEEQFDRLRLR